MREVAVLGIGQTPANEHWDKSLRELAGEAVLAAMQDAGLEPRGWPLCRQHDVRRGQPPAAPGRVSSPTGSGCAIPMPCASKRPAGRARPPSAPALMAVASGAVDTPWRWASKR